MNPTNSSEKLQKSSRIHNSTSYLIDRISSLPEPILSQILSCLSTKHAVATSVLSKRWKFLWTTVLNLDISYQVTRNEQDDFYFSRKTKDEKERILVKRTRDENLMFIRFVNRVLLLHDAGLQLHKFRLVWRYRCIPSQLYPWINGAITRNVRQLVLSLDRDNREPFIIPKCVFSCNTLQSLELEGIMWIPASIVVCLPRLETLKLVAVHFKSEEACQKLIQGCPMLHYLYLHVASDFHFQSCKGDTSVFKYIISSPSLRRLELGVDVWNLFFPCDLEIEASSLEYLKLNGLINRIFVKESLSFLVEADIRIYWHPYNNEYFQDTHNLVLEAVRAFDCAKSLTLSTHIMWALSHATTCLSTKFSQLTKFEAGADCCYCRSLEDFIQSSDNLEVLTIYQDSMHLEESHLEENMHDFSNWTAPVEVPRCLLNSLREVIFDGYSNSDNEREMIGYILKHGSVLEVMKISCYRRNKHLKFERVQQEICNFPRSHWLVESNSLQAVSVNLVLVKCACILQIS